MHRIRCLGHMRSRQRRGRHFNHGQHGLELGHVVVVAAVVQLDRFCLVFCRGWSAASWLAGLLVVLGCCSASAIGMRWAMAAAAWG
ncbi:hypothetical protein BCR44DRAFT_1428688 [Catenaria anguillulae PL171]|uniref:Uncharacterized protein n=1 Tax=Catenaria anguillulae PL171 TaxID=765915 RepID=A0A1Y2HVK5_9FUNG|nr:hypothetical protein BCR44DRAFT_1428688 [Catenaria anguillulae PL171]